MTKRVKKDRLSNWDAGGDNNFNDDQDDYISERSSITSVEGHFRGPEANNNNNNQQQQQQQQQQQDYQDPYYTGEGPHTLRYFYNELPEGGVPAATQVKESKKEEKKRLKEELQARRGQGNLVQGPDTNQPEVSDNYYPYWYYYKAKNPDWIMRQQQYADAEFMPAIDPTKRIEPIDPSQFPHEPKLTAATRKARAFQYGDRGTPDMEYNQQRQRYEMMGKNGAKSGVSTDENNDKQQTTSKQYIPLKDGDDKRLSQNGRYSRSDPRSKLQSEYDWAEHYSQYMRNKSSLGNNDNTYRPNIRSRNHKSRKNYDPLEDIYGRGYDQNGNPIGNGNGNRNRNRNGMNNNYPNGGRNYNGQHRSMSQTHQYNNNSSAPHSQQQSHYNSQTNLNQHHSAPHNDPNRRHNHTHSHNHSQPHNLTSNDFTGSQFKVTDASLKNSRSRFQTQNTRNSYGQAPPSIYNQNSYLPPITRDSFNRPHPIDYYGTQALTNDWKTLSYAPTMYKANAQTKFYDRYLTNVIDKRLFT